jgi:hypothetical protein
MTRHITTRSRVRNNGGTIMYAGNFSVGNITKGLGIESAGYHPRKFDNAAGSPATATQIGNGTSTRGLWKPYTSGNYNNKQVAGTYVMMKYSNTLAGVANTTLNFAAAAPYVRHIHRSERLRTTNLTAWSWTRSSGTNAHGDPKNITVYAATKSQKSEVLANVSGGLFTGNDSAARPTRAVPGEFVIMVGAKNPSTLDYQPRTN